MADLQPERIDTPPGWHVPVAALFGAVTLATMTFLPTSTARRNPNSCVAPGREVWLPVYWLWGQH